MTTRLLLPVLAPLLVACGDDTTDSSTTTTDTTTEDSGTNTNDTVTWYADISPLMQTHCNRCHYDGGLGTGDFSDYTTAAALAEVMVAQIDDGWMPPPVSDPDCREYHGSDAMYLSPEGRDLIQAWVDADTPEGDPADAVVIDSLNDSIQDPDLVIMLPEPYIPTYSNASQPGNEYRCFVLDDVPEDDFYVTSMQPVIDNMSMSHHVVLFSVRENSLTDTHRAPEGFDCINGEEFQVITGFVGGWAPGDLPLELPEGVAMKFDGGEPLILQMHYFDPGTLPQGTSDHPGYAFKTTETPETIADFEVWGTYNFDIPAGEESYSATATDTTNSRKDMTIYSVWPHMHLLGWEAEMKAITPDGDETCLVDGRYNFNNQVPYYFKEPYVAPAGSQVEFTCTWNNSESNPHLLGEPKDTRYGERTDEEMCFFFALASTAN